MSVVIDGTAGVTTPAIDAAAGNADLTTLSVAGNEISAVNSLGFRNRIINGAMVIDQRNAGASVTATNGGYTLDRWFTYSSQASKFTVQRNAGSVTPPAGYINYLGVTSSSAYSVLASDYFAVIQNIEGLNVADLAWGSANAATVTLSFWVRSSLTGTFGGSLENSAANRTYPFSYTISAANTWEQKSITIAGDTSGTWLTTNGIGIRVQFGLGVGSNNASTAGAWTAGDFLSATGAVSVVGTNGATFYITGVQLEAGSVASPFERRDYGRELIMCQRYGWGKDATSGNTTNWNVLWYSGKARVAITTPVPMRSSVTATFTGSTSGAFFTTNDDSNYRNFNYDSTYSEGSGIYPTLVLNLTDSGGGAATTGGAVCYIQNSRSIFFSSEL